MIKRSLVLVCYSHLEGFCKFALESYAGAINSYGLSCKDVSPAIVAASLSKVFAALREQNYRHSLFKNALPDDTVLHMAAREMRFIESFTEFHAMPVRITERSYDTRSNIDTDVLRKLLFQLGVSLDGIESHRNNINRLLGIRNAIAHGDRLRVPKDKQLQEYVDTTITVMKELQQILFSALEKKAYLRAEVPA